MNAVTSNISTIPAKDFMQLLAGDGVQLLVDLRDVESAESVRFSEAFHAPIKQRVQATAQCVWELYIQRSRCPIYLVCDSTKGAETVASWWRVHGLNTPEMIVVEGGIDACHQIVGGAWEGFVWDTPLPESQVLPNCRGVLGAKRESPVPRPHPSMSGAALA